MTELKLGYIGLGNQGTPMAKRLAAWPGGLIVFDVRTDAMTPLAELGATLADSVADVAAADVISVTVLTDEQVRDVVAELAGHAKPGTVIAIHSTIEPGTASELAEQLRHKGIHIVDAPVSGGAGAADKGQLAVMVGADDGSYETVKPVFKQWASMVVRAGEPGAGTRMKLARNMLTFIGFAAACEAQKLAEAAGIDLQKLGRVVRHSDAQSGGPGAIMARDNLAPLTPDHLLFTSFTHTRGLAEKDLRLALGLGESTGVNLPLAEIALRDLAAGLGVPIPLRRQRNSAMDELREQGLAKMNEVYSWEMPDIEGDPYFDLTVEHLFGSIWTRPGLSMRDKRLMTLAVVTAVGTQDLAEVQVNAALANGELTEEELKEMAIFLTHYVGFPLGSGLNGAVGRVVAKRKKAAAAGRGEDKRANVNAAVKMNTDKTLDD